MGCSCPRCRIWTRYRSERAPRQCSSPGSRILSPWHIGCDPLVGHLAPWPSLCQPPKQNRASPRMWFSGLLSVSRTFLGSDIIDSAIKIQNTLPPQKNGRRLSCSLFERTRRVAVGLFGRLWLPLSVTWRLSTIRFVLVFPYYSIHPPSSPSL